MTTLSSEDLRAISSTQQLILSADTYDSPEAWMDAVTQASLRLFSASEGIFTLSTRDDSALLVGSIPDRALAEYEACFASDDLAGPVVTGRPQAYYVEEDFSNDPRFQAHLNSSVYNEWYRPQRLTDSVGMFVRGDGDGGPEIYARNEVFLSANLLLSQSGAANGVEADVARTKLALLQPAFAAAVRLIRHSAKNGNVRGEALLDAMDGAFWLFDLDGVCRHESTGTTERLPGPVEREMIRAGAFSLARGMLRSVRTQTTLSHIIRLESSGGELRLRGAFVRGDDRQRAEGIVVRIDESQQWHLPSTQELRVKLGLTRQEARVALLRAVGKSTEDISSTLGISIHTVRRHTENLRAKLQISRTSEIGPRLLSLTDRT
jgi:DNA-binding CsgD family transcriptional regulator